MGKQAKESEFVTCPECDKQVRADNLGKHMRKIHGIKSAGVQARPKVAAPFSLGKALAAVVVICVIVIAAVIIATRSPPSKPAPSFSIDPPTGDFGNIKKGQTATREFTIFNYGDAPLKINDVSTSCDCTQLTITYDNQTSPVLKKSGNPEYSITIAPGRNAKMTVTIDSSMFSQTGPVYRTIYISTNDKAQKNVEVTLTIMVAP